jgi:hypothetical protein
MKSAELNKIMKGLNFPVRFIKKGRLAYTIIEHDTDPKYWLDFILIPHLIKILFWCTILSNVYSCLFRLIILV